VLVAVFLRALASWLRTWTGIPPGWGVATVILVLVGATVVVWWWAAPGVGHQVDSLIEDIPRLTADATAALRSYGWGRWLLEQARDTTVSWEQSGVLRRATAVAGAGIGLLGNLLVILLVGLFLAAEPRVYRDGLLRLVPVARRDQAGALLQSVAETLRAWMFGKFIAMAVIFIFTWVGLALLDVPLAFTLALLAALLTFIPNFGPILSAIPAVLLALQDGVTTALAVVGLYAGAQAIETYVLTPLIQRKTMSLPPALTLVTQVAMGVITGGIGLILAGPLTAAVVALGRGLTPPLDDGVAHRT
jgi:predicted PurR-regulated permease PerM